MASGYKLIPLDDVVPGMMLSDDFLDRRGHVLLPKGSILTEKLLASLRRYEMDLIPVMTQEDVPEAASMNTEHYKDRVEILFRRKNYSQPLDNVNDVLQHLVLDYRLKEE